MSRRDVASYLTLTDNIGSKLGKFVNWLLNKLPIKATSKRKLSIVLDRLILDVIDENRESIVIWLKGLDPANRVIVDRSQVITESAPRNHTLTRTLTTLFPLLFEIIPQIFAADDRLDTGRDFCRGIIECIEFARLLANHKVYDTELCHLSAYADTLVEDFDENIAIRDDNKSEPPPDATDDRPVRRVGIGNLFD